MVHFPTHRRVLAVRRPVHHVTGPVAPVEIGILPAEHPRLLPSDLLLPFGRTHAAFAGDFIGTGRRGPITGVPLTAALPIGPVFPSAGHPGAGQYPCMRTSWRAAIQRGGLRRLRLRGPRRLPDRASAQCTGPRFDVGARRAPDGALSGPYGGGRQGLGVVSPSGERGAAGGPPPSEDPWAPIAGLLEPPPRAVIGLADVAFQSRRSGFNVRGQISHWYGTSGQRRRRAHDPGRCAPPREWRLMR